MMPFFLCRGHIVWMGRHRHDLPCHAIIPVLLGDGLALFHQGYAMTTLQLAHCKTYSSGFAGVI